MVAELDLHRFRLALAFCERFGSNKAIRHESIRRNELMNLYRIISGNLWSYIHQNVRISNQTTDALKSPQ